MQYVKLFFIFSTLFLVKDIFAQEISASEMKTDVLKMAAHFDKENIELRYSKTIYQDKNDSKPMNQTSGVYYAGNSPYYRLEEKNTLTIQNSTYSMTIDSTEQKIFIDRTRADFSPVDLNVYQNDSILNAQKFTKTIKGNYIIYTIQSKEGDNGTIEMYVNQKDFFLYKINFYMPKGNYFQESMDDESIEQPLLVITYNNPKKLSVNDNLFFTSTWLNSETKPFSLTQFANSYQLIDLRYEPNTSK